MTAFHELGEVFFEKTSLFDSTLTNGMMEDLRPIAATVLAIFVIWRVIQIMTGSNKNPVVDVAIEVMVWAIIWGFIFNSSYLSMVTNGMNEIYTWAGGGKGFFKNLDTWYASLSTAGETFYEMDKSKYVKFQGAIAQMIILLGAVVLAIIPFLIIIASSMLMQIIIMLAPFLILTLVFPALKTMFYNGLGLFLRVTFTMLIISIIQKSFLLKINGFVLAASKSVSTGVDVDLLGSSVLILVMCIVYGGMLYSAVPIAKVISGSIYNIQIGSKNL